MRIVSAVQSDLDQPIVFRTCSESVFTSSLETGSIWLRSASYYQTIENDARIDNQEGINATSAHLPLEIHPPGGVRLRLEGPGRVGQEIIPHYLACFHSSSIQEEQRLAFGAHTMGVRNLFRLALAVVHECNRQIGVTAYRYGAVNYRHTALAQKHAMVGSSPIQVTGDSPVNLTPVGTDVLTKAPVPPFIGQDEWRIAVFTEGHHEQEPLKINVDPGHFYPYAVPDDSSWGA